MTPRCSRCGEAASAGALFCGACGARLEEEPGEGGGDPLVGRTLAGKYLVQRRVGGGGMGEVYRAIHLTLQSPVALKIVKRELVVHPAMVHRFQREARAASRLRHPNVVSVTDFGHAEGTLFMVMEFVAGRSLARIIADEAPLPERRVVHLGAQILAALAEAHAQQILHRDLKPENVMVEARRDAPETVKVLDFGIAKVLAADEAASTLTQAGLVCGTPGYMSPEQLRGGELDGRSDLFSVGVVLYEMLTRKLPFDVATPMEMLHKHLSEPVPAPGERAERDLTPALEALVLRALSPVREERPESAESMRAELLRALPAPPREPRARASTSGAGRGRGTPRPAVPSPPATPALQGTPSQPGRASWDPGVVERACRDLAPYIGPLARVLVRRACERAHDAQELYALLASAIPSAADRERFRRLAPHPA